MTLKATLIFVFLSLYGASAVAERGRLMATGGATTFEGAAGGGIVPMAVIGGYCTREQLGATAFASRVKVPDYELVSFGAAGCWRNRLELSLADQKLSHPTLSGALGVVDETIRQTVAGVKLRLLGDILYTAYPQVSVGVQYKHNHDFAIPTAAGAVRDSDAEAYVAASKVYLGGFFGYNLLVNGAARYTRANQTGLVGFGGDINDDRQWLGEASAGVFYNKHWLMGAEYRQKPDNLSFASEDDWRSAFVAWFPNKRLSLVAAYVDLGEVATLAQQDGWYLSLQGSF